MFFYLGLMQANHKYLKQPQCFKTILYNLEMHISKFYAWLDQLKNEATS